MSEMTAGERYRLDHPDWPHECCWPHQCSYRVRKGDVNMCQIVGDCDFRVPPRAATGKTEPTAEWGRTNPTLEEIAREQRLRFEASHEQEAAPSPVQPEPLLARIVSLPPPALSPQARALIEEGVEAITDGWVHTSRFSDHCPLCDWVNRAKAMLAEIGSGQAEPRLLADGEIIQRGDEFQDFDGAWKPVPDKMWGKRYAATVCPIRRPNAPRERGAVAHTLDGVVGGTLEDRR